MLSSICSMKILKNVHINKIVRPTNVNSCFDYFARSYKNFGHKPIEVPMFTRIWHGFLCISFMFGLLNPDWILEKISGKKQESDQEMGNE